VQLPRVRGTWQPRKKEWRRNRKNRLGWSRRRHGGNFTNSGDTIKPNNKERTTENRINRYRTALFFVLCLINLNQSLINQIAMQG